MKSVTFPFMVWIAVTAIPPLYSQNTGFQIGQSQPAQPAQLQNSQALSGSILIAPMTSPIQPTANPILPLTGTNTLQQTKAAPEAFSGIGNGAVTILPAGGTVFVPAGTMVIESGAGMLQGAFLSAPLSPPAPQPPSSPGMPQSPGIPSGSRGGGTAMDRSNRTANTGQQASPPDVTRLALGTSRDKVIEKYGNPIAFIMNMNGETLYFKNGVVVFIRDGVLAAPTTTDETTRR
jgi:hypothetical protein